MRKCFFDTKVWNNSSFMEMHESHKLMYIFLMTNPYVSWCGIYKIPLSQISFYLGSRETPGLNLFHSFLKQYPDIVRYDEDTEEIAILDWPKNNFGSLTQNSKAAMERSLKDVQSEYLLMAMIEAAKSTNNRKVFAYRLREFRKEKKELSEIMAENPSSCPNELKTNELSSKLKLNLNKTKLKLNLNNMSDSDESDFLSDSEGSNEKKLGTDEDAEFEEFWNRYHEFGKNKEGRKAARSAWNKLSKKDKQSALNAIAQYDAFLKAKENEWRKKMLASRWINKREFENEWKVSSGGGKGVTARGGGTSSVSYSSKDMYEIRLLQQMAAKSEEEEQRKREEFFKNRK